MSGLRPLSLLASEGQCELFSEGQLRIEAEGLRGH